MAKSDDKEKDKGPDKVKIKVASGNELLILAAAMVSSATRGRLVQKGIRPENFKIAGHAAAWAAFLEMHRRGLDYDPETAKSIDSSFDTSYFGKLEKARPEVPPNLEFHVASLFWNSARVRVAEGPLQSFLEVIQDPSEHPDRVRALAQQIVDGFKGHGSRRFLRDAAEVGSIMLDELERRRTEQTVWPFGLQGLDEFEEGHPQRKKGRKWRVAPGAKPGLLCVVTGISSIGKSTLVANLVLGLMRQRRRVLWGVWEDEPDMNYETLAAISLGLDRNALANGDFTDEEFESIKRTAEKMRPWLTFFDIPFGREIDTKTKPSNERNLDVVHQHIADAGCDVFVADVWNRCLVDRRPESEEAGIIRTLAIARETKTFIIATHQQRLKDIERREDFRPTREGLKGSAALIEVPDYVFGLHRPDFFKLLHKTTIEVHCLKRRRGPAPWAVSFDFDLDRGIISGGKTVPHDAGPSGKRKAKDEFLDDDDEG